jgi:hypothetical protein
MHNSRMLHVMQCALRSRIEMTAAGAVPVNWRAGSDDVASAAGRGDLAGMVSTSPSR